MRDYVPSCLRKGTGTWLSKAIAEGEALTFDFFPFRRDMVIHFVDCLWEGATMRGHADNWFRRRPKDFAVFEARVRGWSGKGKMPHTSIEHLTSEAVRAELLLTRRPKENPSAVALWVTDFFRDMKIFVAGQQTGFIGAIQAAREDSTFSDHFAAEASHLPRHYVPLGNGDPSILHSQSFKPSLDADLSIGPSEDAGLVTALSREAKRCGGYGGSSAGDIDSGAMASLQAEHKDNFSDTFDQLSRPGREAAG
jgi:hypothetical protein